MKSLCQYRSFFSMMHSFAQDGPPPYGFTEQETSSSIMRVFGAAQLCGDSGWEQRLRWLEGPAPAADRGAGASGGGADEEEDNAFLLSFFAFKRAQSHWEEEDRRAAAEREEDGVMEEEVGTVLGQYVSDDGGDDA